MVSFTRELKVFKKNLYDEVFHLCMNNMVITTIYLLTNSTELMKSVSRSDIVMNLFSHECNENILCQYSIILCYVIIIHTTYHS